MMAPTRLANAAALALIRLTNAAAQLPYGSSETKGVLLLRSQTERKAASATNSGKSQKMVGSFRGVFTGHS